MNARRLLAAVLVAVSGFLASIVSESRRLDSPPAEAGSLPGAATPEEMRRAEPAAAGGSPMSSCTDARCVLKRDYRARIDGSGLLMEGAGHWIHLEAARVIQGGVEIACVRGAVTGDSNSVRIDRGVLVEEYRLEETRVEQLFHLPRAPGTGALRVAVAVRSDLTGAVEGPGDFSRGLGFCDPAGRRRLDYYGAVAIDTAGARVEFEPDYENGEIVLEVPETFMAEAAFPLTVDPWVEFGGDPNVSRTSGTSYGASVAVAPDGHPVVAWLESREGVYLRKWDGSAWISLGQSDRLGGVSGPYGSPAVSTLAIKADGEPVVIWSELVAGGFANFEIYAKEWNGSDWVELGGSATGGGISATPLDSNFPSVAVDPQGRILVAWQETNPTIGSADIFLRRWNGREWEEIAGSASAGGIGWTPERSYLPSLALDSRGTPAVAWTELTSTGAQAYFRVLAGSAWVELGRSATDGGVSRLPSPSGFSYTALKDDGTGRPFIAWLSGSSVHLRHWNGSEWEELAGSASGGGISGSVLAYGPPVLAVHPSGVPILAYSAQEDRWSPSEMFVRVYFEGRWVGPRGSGTGGGISATPEDWSDGPSMALDSRGRPVIAWTEWTRTGSDIFLRGWR